MKRVLVGPRLRPGARATVAAQAVSDPMVGIRVRLTGKVDSDLAAGLEDESADAQARLLAGRLNVALEDIAETYPWLDLRATVHVDERVHPNPHG